MKTNFHDLLKVFFYIRIQNLQYVQSFIQVDEFFYEKLFFRNSMQNFLGHPVLPASITSTTVIIYT